MKAVTVELVDVRPLMGDFGTDITVRVRIPAVGEHATPPSWAQSVKEKRTRRSHSGPMAAEVPILRAADVARAASLGGGIEKFIRVLAVVGDGAEPRRVANLKSYPAPKGGHVWRFACTRCNAVTERRHLHVLGDDIGCRECVGGTGVTYMSRRFNKTETLRHWREERQRAPRVHR